MATTTKKATAKKSSKRVPAKTRNNEAGLAVRHWATADGCGRQTEAWVRANYGVHEFVLTNAKGATKDRFARKHVGMEMVWKPEANEQERLLCALCGYRPWNSLHSVDTGK